MSRILIWSVCLCTLQYISAEYSIPCTKDSLQENDYQLQSDLYFCTAPVRQLYDDSDRADAIESVVLPNLYEYPLNVTTLPPQPEYTQPCNCFGQPIHWKAETLFIEKNQPIVDDFLLAIRNRNLRNSVEEWNPLQTGTPCTYTQLGYSWAISSETSPDPLILSIPGGDFITAVRTGADDLDFDNANANPIDCGVLANNVYQTALISPPNGGNTTGANFVTRPGSMPITDYCAASKYKPMDNWTTYTPTERVFKATLLRYGGAIEMVRQCSIGIVPAMFMLSGLFTGGSQMPVTIKTILKSITRLNLPDPVTLNSENLVLACSTKQIAITFHNAVEMFQLYLKNSVFLVKNPSPETALYSAKMNTEQYTNLYFCGSPIFSGIGETTFFYPQIIYSSCSMRFDYLKKPIQKNPSAGTLLYLDSKSSTMHYNTDNLLIYTVDRKPVPFNGRDVYSTFQIVGIKTNFIPNIGANANCDVYTFDFDLYKKASTSTPVYISASCWKKNFEGQIRKPGAEWYDPSLATNQGFQCGGMMAIVAATAGSVAGKDSYQRTIKFTYECVLLTSQVKIVLPEAPPIAVYNTVEGKHNLSLQMAAVFEYVHQLDGLYTKKNVLMEEFANILNEMGTEIPDTDDLYESDFLNVDNDDVTVAHGIFETSSIGKLDTTVILPENNPFMPTGFVLNLASCMLDSTTLDNTLVTPGQIAYFTKEQILSTYHNFFGVFGPFSNGFITNLMALYTMMDFTQISLPTPTTITNSHFFENDGNDIETMVGYNIDKAHSNTSFYFAILGDTCQPPVPIFNSKTSYFATDIQSSVKSEYNTIQLPLFNSIISTSFSKEYPPVVYTRSTNTSDFLCYVYGESTGSAPTLHTVPNGTLCTYILEFNPHLINTTGGYTDTYSIDFTQPMCTFLYNGTTPEYTTKTQPVDSLEACLLSGGNTTNYDYCPETKMHYCNNIASASLYGMSVCDQESSCSSKPTLFANACPNTTFDYTTLPANMGHQKYILSAQDCTSAGGTNYYFCPSLSRHYCTITTPGSLYTECTETLPENSCPSNPFRTKNACPQSPTIDTTRVYCECEATQNSGCNLPPPWTLMQYGLSRLLPGMPYISNTAVYDTTTAPENNAGLDTVHCVSKTIQENTTWYLEKPLFNNPLFNSTEPDNKHRPPGLSRPQLRQWCSQFSETECTGYNQSQISFQYCMVNYTEPSPRTCYLRVYDYGSLSRIKGTYNYTRPNVRCSFWNAELDEPWMCQQPTAFTGCVLVNTRGVLGNTTAYAFKDTTYTGTSIRIPNSNQRFVTVPHVPVYRNYNVLKTLVFTVLTDTPPVNATDDLGDCTCRYINNNGIQHSAYYTIGNNYTVLDVSHYASNGFFSNAIRNNPSHFYQLIYIPINPIAITIPTATEGVTRTNTYINDINRIALRCTCDNSSVQLASHAFELLESVQPQSILTSNQTIQSTENHNHLSLSLACVPFIERALFTENNNIYTGKMNTGLIQQAILQTSPNDCSGLAQLTGAEDPKQAIADYKTSCNNQINGYSGLCKKSRTDAVSCNIKTGAFWYANTGSSITQSTQWFTAASASESLSGYFFDLNNESATEYDTTTTADKGCLDLGTCTAAEFTGRQCTEASTGDCGLMIDMHFIQPCSLLGQVSVPTCSKPQLQLIFPEVNSAAPNIPGAPVNFPYNIWKWQQGIAAFTNTKTSDNPTQILKNSLRTNLPAYWDLSLMLIHYCDRYLGGFVFCNNDPNSIQKRAQLCQELNASIIYAGTTLRSFELQDVCPFLNTNIPNTGLQTCFVFPGDVLYGSVSSVIAQIRAQTNIVVADITFYYVPFSIRALRIIFMNAAFSDTLITNSFNGRNATFINNQNKDETGPNAQKLASPLLAGIARQLATGKTNKTVLQNEQGICDRAIGLSLDVIELYFFAIESTRDVNTGNYHFISVDTSQNQSTQNTVILTHAQVFPEISESSARIPYNNIHIRPAVSTDYYTTTISNNVGIGIDNCNRFIIDGIGFQISDITIDQSGCNHLDEANKIPIVFAGSQGSDAKIENMIVINAPVITAMFGHTTRYSYAETPVIDGSNSIMTNNNLYYTADSTLPHSSRNNIGIFGSTVGTVFMEIHTVLTGSNTDTNFDITCNVVYCGCDIDTICYQTRQNQLTTEQSLVSCNDNTTDAQTYLGFVFNTTETQLQQTWFLKEDTEENFQIENNGVQWTVVITEGMTREDFIDLPVIIQNKTTRNEFGFTLLDPSIIDGFDTVDTQGSSQYASLIIRNRTWFNETYSIAQQILINTILQNNQLCIYKDTTDNSLKLTFCRSNGIVNTSLAFFYHNIQTAVVHLSGLPFLCPTARVNLTSAYSFLYMEPCMPCDVGTQQHLECTQTIPETSTQWITETMLNAFDLFFPNQTSFSTLPHLYLNQTIPGLCLTAHTPTSFSWEICDSCSWEKTRFSLGPNRALYPGCESAVGIERFACNPYSTASLYSISTIDTTNTDNTAFCSNTFTTTTKVNGQKYGLGAKVTCASDNTLTVIRGGYGYSWMDNINQSTLFKTDTQRVIVQPYADSGFNIANQGMEFINLTTYTAVFGKAFEYNIFAAPPRLDSIVTTFVIIIFVLNCILIFVFIAIIFYKDQIRNHYLQQLENKNRFLNG